MPTQIFSKPVPLFFPQQSDFLLTELNGFDLLFFFLFYYRRKRDTFYSRLEEQELYVISHYHWVFLLSFWLSVDRLTHNSSLLRVHWFLRVFPLSFFLNSWWFGIFLLQAFPSTRLRLILLSLSLSCFCRWVSLSSLTVLIGSLSANLCIDLFMKHGLLLCEHTAWARHTGCLRGKVILTWSVVIHRQALTWSTYSVTCVLDLACARGLIFPASGSLLIPSDFLESRVTSSFTVVLNSE